MNIKDCFWENNNLGCTACEIELAIDELLPPKDILDNLCSKYNYQTIKANTNNITLCQQLSKYGFYFVETQIGLAFGSKSFEKMGAYAKTYISKIKLDVCKDKESRDFVLKRIGDEMFYTDRIALDPHFNVQMANRRYRNWILNTIENDNHELCTILCDNNIVGFGYFSIESSRIHYILGGIFPSFQQLGFGITIPLAPVVYMSEHKRNIFTNVSSNNINMVKCYIECGYHIVDFKYVFSRFNK